jgi:hypothetical protein
VLRPLSEVGVVSRSEHYDAPGLSDSHAVTKVLATIDSETIVVKLLRSLTGGLEATGHESDVTLPGQLG